MCAFFLNTPLFIFYFRDARRDARRRVFCTSDVVSQEERKELGGNKENIQRAEHTIGREWNYRKWYKLPSFFLPNSAYTAVRILIHLERRRNKIAIRFPKADFSVFQTLIFENFICVVTFHIYLNYSCIQVFLQFRCEEILTTEFFLTSWCNVFTANEFRYLR